MCPTSSLTLHHPLPVPPPPPRAWQVIYENVDADANIIFGALVDNKITSGEVSITVLATGFVTDFFDTDEEVRGIGPRLLLALLFFPHSFLLFPVPSHFFPARLLFFPLPSRPSPQGLDNVPALKQPAPKTVGQARQFAETPAAEEEVGWPLDN